MADWDLWMRLIDHGRRGALPEALAGYVVHAGGCTPAPGGGRGGLRPPGRQARRPPAGRGRHPERAILA
jgi:hypothetical protein